MKLLVVALALFATPLAIAQAPTPTPTPVPEPNSGVHFETFTGYSRLTSGANATYLGARLPITPRWSVDYLQYQVPSAGAQIYLAGPEFRDKLVHLIKSKAVQPNLTGIEVYLSGGLGTKRDDQGNNPTFAYGFYGGADVPIGQIGGGTLSVGFRVGYLGIPKQTVGPKHFLLTNTGEIAPGLTLRF